MDNVPLTPLCACLVASVWQKRSTSLSRPEELDMQHMDMMKRQA